MYTIYHNPRCSKSREALALLEEHARREGEQLNVVEYLLQPLGLAELKKLQQQLGVPVADMVRSNETEFLQLGLADANPSALLEALATHPRLLQRPIVSDSKRAIIARPPERLASFLTGSD